MRLLLLTLLVAAAAAKVRYDGYVVLEMHAANPQQLKYLRDWMNTDITVDFWLEPRQMGAPCHVMVSPVQLYRVQSELHANGIAFSVLHSDVQADIDREESQRKQAFNLDDFNTFEDIESWMDEQVANCNPSYSCSKYSIGKTYEGRDMWVFSVEKPGASNVAHWVDSTIHAREWLAPATLLKMLDKVLNDPTDPDVETMMNNYDLYFLPVMNPDGYKYTWDSERLWRKNRAPNSGSTCLGTDLNRNYDWNWGTEGVSHVPCADTFCGSTAGSELETQAVQAEAERLAALHSPLASWITIHSYGNMWMWPWGNTINHNGFTCERADDHDDMQFVGDAASAAIENTYNTNWAAGTSCEVIYETTGATDDYVKGRHDVKYPVCPELRGNGFIINASEIDPSFREIWNGFVEHIKKINERSGW